MGDGGVCNFCYLKYLDYKCRKAESTVVKQKYLAVVFSTETL